MFRKDYCACSPLNRLKMSRSSSSTVSNEPVPVEVELFVQAVDAQSLRMKDWECLTEIVIQGWDLQYPKKTIILK